MQTQALSTPKSLATTVSELRFAVDSHPLWTCRLLEACTSGKLCREDFAYIFSQYYEYSRNFTRYLSAAMANCDDEKFRARLSENLWEEGGGADPQRRHAEIFRRFLSEGLGVDTANIEARDFSKIFAQSYLDFCMKTSPAAASAFLSLGTEAIVPRLYRVFRQGLARAGVEPPHLEFFDIHIEGDDAHSETLLDMMCSRAREAGWVDTCRNASRHALDLRLEFFDALFDALAVQRVHRLVAALDPAYRRDPSEKPLLHQLAEIGTPLYKNSEPEANIEFSVERLPFACDVLDPRMVHVPKDRTNELHRHAHETIIHVIRGKAAVKVGDRRVEAAPGDTVFVPRWCLHQAHSIGEEDLVYLAITDFGFASRGYSGDYLDGHRRNKAGDSSFSR